MRLWHKDLIDVLPRQQLLAQWRECCCIARNIAVNGTPNHILVNKILDYPIDHFIQYTALVLYEMSLRGYNFNINNFQKWTAIIAPERRIVNDEELFDSWHNGRYFQQCYFNLQEKYDCGGITEEEWEPINTMYMDSRGYKYIKELKEYVK